jgi:hypothetical protein
MDSSPIDEWYAPLGPGLSQGDIIRVVPSGLIDAPLTICQPPNTSPQGKANYYPIDQLPKHRSVQYLHAKFTLGLGIVVWPDCQVDKLANQKRPETDWFAAIAAVKPLTELPAILHPTIQAFGRAQFFPLPAKAPGIAHDCYVDLRHIWALRYALLKDRITTLTKQARLAFALHRFWFDTELQLPDFVRCPVCSTELAPTDLFLQKEDP